MEQSICIFGASSTHGFYDVEKGGWPDRLKSYLYTKNSEEDYYEVFNLGISGNTTEDLLARFKNEASTRKPTIIIISLGDNDSALNISLKKYEENMNTIIKQAKEFTKNIVILGAKKVNEKITNPVPWNKDAHYTNANIQKYDDKLKEISEKGKVSYLSLFNLLNDSDLHDGLHPNSQGHEKIFQVVKDFLKGKRLIN
ncbi:MAG: SGNH/GDSL hydrolase family protein [Nanoarchaeota archaeon]|nr:SGNH/GDSL hydrolase family protein [Nanoarchaeota archaeon]